MTRKYENNRPVRITFKKMHSLLSKSIYLTPKENIEYPRSTAVSSFQSSPVSSHVNKRNIQIIAPNVIKINKLSPSDKSKRVRINFLNTVFKSANNATTDQWLSDSQIFNDQKIGSPMIDSSIEMAEANGTLLSTRGVSEKTSDSIRTCDCPKEVDLANVIYTSVSNDTTCHEMDTPIKTTRSSCRQKVRRTLHRIPDSKLARNVLSEPKLATSIHTLISTDTSCDEIDASIRSNRTRSKPKSRRRTSRKILDSELTSQPVTQHKLLPSDHETASNRIPCEDSDAPNELVHPTCQQKCTRRATPKTLISKMNHNAAKKHKLVEILRTSLSNNISSGTNDEPIKPIAATNCKPKSRRQASRKTFDSKTARNTVREHNLANIRPTTLTNGLANEPNEKYEENKQNRFVPIILKSPKMLTIAKVKMLPRNNLVPDTDHVNATETLRKEDTDHTVGKRKRKQVLQPITLNFNRSNSNLESSMVDDAVEKKPSTGSDTPVKSVKTKRNASTQAPSLSDEYSRCTLEKSRRIPTSLCDTLHRIPSTPSSSNALAKGSPASFEALRNKSSTPCSVLDRSVSPCDSIERITSALRDASAQICSMLGDHSDEDRPTLTEQCEQITPTMSDILEVIRSTTDHLPEPVPLATFDPSEDFEPLPGAPRTTVDVLETTRFTDFEFPDIPMVEDDSGLVLGQEQVVDEYPVDTAIVDIPFAVEEVVVESKTEISRTFGSKNACSYTWIRKVIEEFEEPDYNSYVNSADLCLDADEVTKMILDGRDERMETVPLSHRDEEASRYDCNGNDIKNRGLEAELGSDTTPESRFASKFTSITDDIDLSLFDSDQNLDYVLDSDHIRDKDVDFDWQSSNYSSVSRVESRNSVHNCIGPLDRTLTYETDASMAMEEILDYVASLPNCEDSESTGVFNHPTNAELGGLPFNEELVGDHGFLAGLIEDPTTESSGHPETRSCYCRSILNVPMALCGGCNDSLLDTGYTDYDEELALRLDFPQLDPEPVRDHRTESGAFNPLDNERRLSDDHSDAESGDTRSLTASQFKLDHILFPDEIQELVDSTHAMEKYAIMRESAVVGNEDGTRSGEITRIDNDFESGREMDRQECRETRADITCIDLTLDTEATEDAWPDVSETYRSDLEEAAIPSTKSVRRTEKSTEGKAKSKTRNTKIARSQKQVNTPRDEIIDAPYDCTLCENKRYRCINSWRQHMRKYHPDEYKAPIRPQSDEQYECELCSKKYKVHGALRSHMTLHENHKLTCSDCGLHFSKESLLKQHLLECDPRHNFQCNHCDEKFNKPSALKKHLNLHWGEA